MNKIELLLPAKDLECGKIAINHGADAVYVGAKAYGARQAAGNSISDIENLAKYAHLYGAKVYATVNTLLFDDELEKARKLMWELYNIGVDAVLIQDLGLLKTDIPPIELHASTQCHNATTERIQLLENMGFKRAVLARELSISEISEIRKNCNIELEAFVHGAVCVCYSGQCYISKFMNGRSGNRGDCAQICRTKFNLTDEKGNILIHDKHLLSLHDMSRHNFLEEMILAGISSLKIEGRLKSENYVKNITAFYRQKIDEFIENNKEFRKSSSGTTKFFFNPDENKSFNRGFTPYFIDGKRTKAASFDTPKAIGEPVGNIKAKNNAYFYFGNANLANGDGLCFINNDGVLEGFFVNKVEGNRIFPHKKLSEFTKVDIFRNFDKKFEDILAGKTAERKIAIDICAEINPENIKIDVRDEDGNEISITEKNDADRANNPETAKKSVENALSKLGNTPFFAKSIKIDRCEYFLRTSFVNDLKNKIVELIIEKRIENFQPKDDIRVYSPKKMLKNADFRKNITNEAHKAVYLDFGAENIEYGLDKTSNFNGKEVMTCKYCIRFETGMCKKETSGKAHEDLYLDNGKYRFKLNFDCKNCKMTVLAPEN